MGQYDSVRSTPASEPTDEIDLMDLFAIIWEGRWIIFAVNVIAAIAGFVVIKALPSIYRVEAVLAGPSSYQLQVLQPSTLAQRPSTQEDDPREVYGVDYQVAAIDPLNVYVSALAAVNSLSLKRQYWLAEGREFAGAEFDDEDSEEGLEAFAKSLQLTQPKTVDSTSAVAQLSFLTENPEKGVEVLNRYLAFAERQIMARQLKQLQRALQVSLARLEEDYASLVTQERQSLGDELIRLQEAHEVATALGIRELASEKIENVWLSLLDGRLYLLGSAVLEEEISALTARKDKPLEAFVPRLREMGRWREQINRDLQRLESAAAQVSPFSIVAPPEASLSPVKPNKPLLLIAVVFAAFIVSVFGVLFRHGWKSYHARTAEAE